MSPSILIAGFAVFLTHGLEAITGFGCTVLALPFVTLLLGIVEAKFLLAILAWALAVYIAASKFRRIAWRQYAIILLFVGAGMPIGMYAFATLPRALLIKLLGGFILLSSALQLWKLVAAPALARRRGRGGEAPMDGGRPRPLHFFLLFLGGIVHGAFASGGPLVVLYAARALPEKGNFRATLTLLWATLNTVLIIGFASSGMFTVERWTLLAEMTPFLVAGIVAGELIHNRVRGEVFSTIVFSTLFLTGIFMIAV
jgi:uncharacterized protein